MRSPSSPYPADSRPWSQCLRRFTTEPRDKHHQLLSGEEAVSLPDIGMLRPLEYQVLQKRITSEESQRFAPQARAVLNKHAGEHWSIAQNIACLYYAYCHRDQFEGSCRLPAYLVIDSSANETENCLSGCFGQDQPRTETAGVHCCCRAKSQKYRGRCLPPALCSSVISQEARYSSGLAAGRMLLPLCSIGIFATLLIVCKSQHRS